jgi:hypothetical protein
MKNKIYLFFNLKRDANKRLHDTNDTLSAFMEFTPNQSKSSSPQFQTNNNINPYKRGSLIGDYIQYESNSPHKTFSRYLKLRDELIIRRIQFFYGTRPMRPNSNYEFQKHVTTF